MKKLLITLPFFLTLAGCNKDAGDTAADDDFVGDDSESGDDEDGDDDAGGDVMNSKPGCGATDILCYSFVGELWATQDTNGACTNLSSQAQAAGAGSLTYLSDGCPSGATSECSGILGLVDQEENLLDGSDYSIYFYGGIDGSADCTAGGGNYTTL